jgi:hypothetical protein
MHPPPVPPSGSYLCFPCAFGYFLARTLVTALGGNENPRVRTVPNFAPKIILPSAAASASEHSGASASLATALRSRRARRRVCRQSSPLFGIASPARSVAHRRGSLAQCRHAPHRCSGAFSAPATKRFIRSPANRRRIVSRRTFSHGQGQIETNEHVSGKSALHSTPEDHFYLAPI